MFFSGEGEFYCRIYREELTESREFISSDMGSRMYHGVVNVSLSQGCAVRIEYQQTEYHR